ncbi:hypothetical protein PENTCL1PPCAC_3333, partial [Pristionchus entomophagus]
VVRMPFDNGKYKVRRAVHEDALVLLECAISGFLNACLHAQALKLKRSDAQEFLRWIIQRSLNAPYSVMILDKATGKLAGFRLYSVSHRDISDDFEPFELDCESLSKNMQILGNILDKQKNMIWTLCPRAEKILRQEITFVDPKFQRQGIASHLVNLLNISCL